MKNKYSWCLGVLLLSSISYGAPVRGKKIQPITPVKKRSVETDYSPRVVRSEKKFYLFGGIDLGLASYAKSTVSTDASRSGMALGVRGLAAYYAKKWVIDGGLGFTFISSSGTNTTADILKVYTRTIFIDASGRYRINENWQFGPELQYWLGTDNGLNANIFSSDKNNALMGGVQLIYEWMKDPNKYRLGARWNMDLNMAGRNLNVFQLFFQIGFSPGGGSNEDDRPKFTEELKESDLENAEPEVLPDTAPISTDAVLPEPEPEVMSTPAPIEEEAPLPIGPQAKMVMTLDVNALPFETDSARLPKYNRDRVKEIGRFLGEQKDGWDRLIVSGHTDEQGKKTYNMKLSKARADTVRQLLGEGGAPIEKIKAVGHGPNKPIAKGHNEKAWSKNRRVELEFIGVKDGLVIQKAFKR